MGGGGECGDSTKCTSPLTEIVLLEFLFPHFESKKKQNKVLQPSFVQWPAPP